MNYQKRRSFLFETFFSFEILFSFRINKHRPSLPQISNSAIDDHLTSESDEDNQRNIEHIHQLTVR